jgi:anaerobic ribonucleoside-triphosphate reductase
MVQVYTENGLMREFNLDKIVDSLLKETTLDEKTARRVAKKAAKALEKLEYTETTGSLVRALVVDALRHLGLNDAVKAYAPLTISLYDANSMDTGGEDHDNANQMACPETSHKAKADLISKKQALRMLPNDLAARHKVGDLHIHDADYFTTRPFCKSHDIRYFYRYGFIPDGSGMGASVAGPAKHAEVAILQAVKVLGTAQTLYAGGQGLLHFLTFVSPYLERKSYKEIKQLMQLLVYEVNQMLVARGGQPVFSSVNLTPGIPDVFKKARAVHAGAVSDRLYEEFEPKVRLAFKALLEVMDEGDYYGRPFPFPKLEVCIQKEFLDPETWEESYVHQGEIIPSYKELYQLAFNLAAKTGLPYFDNLLPEYRKADGTVACYQSLTADTLVSKMTDKGMEIVRIDTLSDNDILWTPYGAEKFDKMLVYETDREMIRLKLKGSKIVRCTPEHMFPTTSGRKRADELKLGDKLLVNTTLPSTTYMPTKLAYFLGLYTAEGNILIRGINTGGHRVQLSFGEKNLAYRASRLLEELFHVTPKVKYIRGNEYRVLVYNKKLCQHLLDDLRVGRTTKKVPDGIFTASEDAKWAFIQGLLQGDGHTEHFRSTIETVYPELAAGFSQLCASLGHHVTEMKVSTRKNIQLSINHGLRAFLSMQRGDFSGELEIKEITTERYIGKVYDPIDVENHDFCLGNGIVSGNCCSFSFEDDSETSTEFEDKLNFVNGAHFDLGGLQVVSLNLPRCAYKANHDTEKLWNEIRSLMEDAAKIFLLKREALRKVESRLSFALQHPGDAPAYTNLDGQVFEIGIVGLADMVEYHTGKKTIDSEEAREFAREIIAYMGLVSKGISYKHGIKTVVARTPAETCSQRFAVLDLLAGYEGEVMHGDKAYAREHLQETGNLPVYYSNGVAAWFGEYASIYKRIEAEDSLWPALEGGSISHIFLGETATDGEALMKFSLNLARTTNIGYFTYTKDFTQCELCRHIEGGIHSKCKNCGSEKVETYSRITGYISPTSRWNAGKSQELKDRTRFSV